MWLQPPWSSRHSHHLQSPFLQATAHRVRTLVLIRKIRRVSQGVVLLFQVTKSIRESSQQGNQQDKTCRFTGHLRGSNITSNLPLHHYPISLGRSFRLYRGPRFAACVFSPRREIPQNTNRRHGVPLRPISGNLGHIPHCWIDLRTEDAHGTLGEKNHSVFPHYL